MPRKGPRRELADTLPETPAALAIAAQLRRPEDIDRAIVLLTNFTGSGNLDPKDREELIDLFGLLPTSKENAIEWREHLEAMVDRLPGWD